MFVSNGEAKLLKETPIYDLYKVIKSRDTDLTQPVIIRVPDCYDPYKTKIKYEGSTRVYEYDEKYGAWCSKESTFNERTDVNLFAELRLDNDGFSIRIVRRCSELSEFLVAFMK